MGITKADFIFVLSSTLSISLAANAQDSYVLLHKVHVFLFLKRKQVSFSDVNILKHTNFWFLALKTTLLFCTKTLLFYKNISTISVKKWDVNKLLSPEMINYLEK